MSIREDIASNIATTITNISALTIKKVTRQPFPLEELSEQQYPAVLIQTQEETKEDQELTRNGKALDTEIVSIETDAGTLFPYGGISMTVKVIYEHQSGTL